MPYYAVIRGHVPGVYSDLDDSMRVVEGLSNHDYRKFDRRWEAEVFFITNREDRVPSRGTYYAVIRGRNPGVYRNFSDCMRVVEGFSDYYFRKFAYKSAARVFFRHNREDEYQEYDSQEFDWLEYSLESESPDDDC